MEQRGSSFLELARAVEAARIYNVRVILEGNFPLTDDIQPTIRLSVEAVREVARERGVDWREVFDEVVTGELLKENDAMGGTDHPDPTLHSSPIESGK